MPNISQNIFYIVINLAFLVYSIGIINEIKGNKFLLAIAVTISIPYALITLGYFIDYPYMHINFFIYVGSPIVFVTHIMQKRVKKMLLLALPAFYLIFLAISQVMHLGHSEIIFALSAVPIGIGVYNYFKDSSNEGKVAIIITVALLRYFLLYAHSLTNI